MRLAVRLSMSEGMRNESGPGRRNHEVLTAWREAAPSDAGSHRVLEAIMVGRNEEDEYPDLTESARTQREWKVIHVALTYHPSMAGSGVEKVEGCMWRGKWKVPDVTFSEDTGFGMRLQVSEPH